MPGCGDEQLVRQVPMEGLGQRTTLNQDGPGEFPEMETLNNCRRIQPLFNGAIENKLPLFHFPGNFPQRNQGQPQVIIRLRLFNLVVRFSG